MKQLIKRHHADLIIAWAKGYTIQLLTYKGWDDIDNPKWFPTSKYRIRDEYTHLREAIKEGKRVYHKPTIRKTLEERDLCFAYKNYNKGIGNIETAFININNKPDNYIIEEPIKHEPFNSLEDLKSILGKTVKSGESVGMVTGGYILNGELQIYTGDCALEISADRFLENYTFEDGSVCGKLVK